MILLTAVAFFFIINQACGDCLHGSKEHSGFCYQLAHVRTTWAQANLYCHAFGMHLLTIESAEENGYVVNLIKRVTDHWKDDSVWIGGSDILEEGHFTWVDFLKDVTFTNWYPGNPNNGDGDNDEHCIALSKSHDFQWNDDDCEKRNYFICKSRKTVVGPGEFMG